ncbi:hypothetical protein [Sorangium sp. So ce388]|uniref:hypothetical protein n=1 Tax=Sorangium sp. So ce388 TaxID=3133309 RepID=UPI003F5C113D
MRLQGEQNGQGCHGVAVHEQGRLCTQQMVCVNCGAIPQKFIEHTLLGQVPVADSLADVTQWDRGRPPHGEVAARALLELRWLGADAGERSAKTCSRSQRSADPGASSSPRAR